MSERERSVVVRLRAEAAQFRREFAEASKATDKLGTDAEKASSRAERLVQSARHNQAEWDRAGTVLTAFGAATTAAIVASTRAAISWESAFAGVRKTVDGTAAELGEVEDGLRDLARTLPSTHEEIAGVAEAAGQLGVATRDVVGFTKVMIDLGETTNLSADEAATAIAQLMNVMGTAPANVSRVGSALVALGNNSATTERDILGMAQRLAGAGAVVGATEADILGLAAAVSSVGIEVEAGGTAIARTMTDMARAVSTGGDDLRDFAKVAGVTSAEFARAFKEDPAEALVLFTDGLGRMQDAGEDVFGTLDELGQSDVRVSRALLSMASSGDLLRDSLDLSAQAWAENTALVREAEVRYDTTAAKVQIAQNSLRDAGISIGESLTPAVATAAELVASLASAFARIPAPVQGAIGVLGGVVGVTSLLAGGFLLTFPRVIDTVQAFRTLQQISPSTTAALGKVGKAAAGVGAAMAVMATAGQLQSSAINQQGIGETTRVLLGLADGADNARGAVDALFEGRGGFSDVFWGNNIRDLDEAVKLLTAPDFGMRVDDVLSRVLTLGTRSSTAAEQAKSSFESIDTALANLVASGNAERAAEAVAGLGLSTEEINQLLPGYVDALADADNQQELNAGSAATLAGATIELTDAQKDLLEEVRGADTAFIDLFRAYDTLVAKNVEAAETTAKSTKTAKDSWQDYYDGFTVNLQEYLTELEEQVAAQEAWETNMLILAGRVSEGTLAELARMGPEGAPLVAQLVDASDDELARLDDVMAQRTGEGVDAFVARLADALPVIQAASAELGQEAAAEIAAKLAEGTSTVEEIMEEYGLVIEGTKPTVTVKSETEAAEAALGRVQGHMQWLMRYSGLTVNVGVNYVRSRNTAGSLYDDISGKYGAPGGATGGLIAGTQIRGFHAGGYVPGTPPADPRLDNVLATNGQGLFALRSGEYVSTQESTKRNMAALAAGNRGAKLTVSGFATGGVVGRSMLPAPGLMPATRGAAPGDGVSAADLDRLAERISPVNFNGPVTTHDPDELAHRIERHRRNVLAVRQITGKL